MGKQRRYRFPKDINAIDRHFYPHRPMPSGIFGGTHPTNKVVDLFGYDNMISDTDPYGSYTGVPKDVDDKPIQDADDL